MSHIENYLVRIANFLWERKNLLFMVLGLTGIILIPAVYFDVESGHSERLVIGLSSFLLFWCLSLLFFAQSYRGEHLPKGFKQSGYRNPLTYASILFRCYGVVFFILFFGGLSLLTIYALFGFATEIIAHMQSLFA